MDQPNVAANHQRVDAAKDEALPKLAADRVPGLSVEDRKAKTADNLAAKSKQHVSKKRRRSASKETASVKSVGASGAQRVLSSTDVTPSPPPFIGSGCLRFEDFLSSNDTLKVGDLVITKGNEIALVWKVTLKKYMLGVNRYVEKYQVIVDRNEEVDQIKRCTVPLTDMCKKFLNCTYESIAHNSRVTKAVKFEEQLAYIEAINLQVKFKTEFQKCKSDIDLFNWLKFLLIALHHEPYIGRNIIVFNASQILWWKGKFDEKLIETTANKVSYDNAKLFDTLVERAKFLEENIHLLPPPPEKGSGTTQIKVGSKKQSWRQQSLNNYVLKQKRNIAKKEKLEEQLTSDMAQTLGGKSFRPMENGIVVGKRVKKKAGALTQGKKTRKVESSTVKKNTVKSQEQKAIKIGGNGTQKKVDTLPTGKEIKKEIKGNVPRNKKKVSNRKKSFGHVLSLGELCLSQLRHFVSAAKSLDQDVVCQEEIVRVVSEMRGVLNELQDQNSTA
eukprot:g11723.t1